MSGYVHPLDEHWHDLEIGDTVLVDSGAEAPTTMGTLTAIDKHSNRGFVTPTFASGHWHSLERMERA